MLIGEDHVHVCAGGWTPIIHGAVRAPGPADFHVHTRMDHAGEPRAYRLLSAGLRDETPSRLTPPPDYSLMISPNKPAIHECVFVEARHRTPAKNSWVVHGDSLASILFQQSNTRLRRLRLELVRWDYFGRDRPGTPHPGMARAAAAAAAVVPRRPPPWPDPAMGVCTLLYSEDKTADCYGWDEVNLAYKPSGGVAFLELSP